MATIKVLNVAQANPEAPVQIKLGVVNEPEKPIQYVGIPGPQGPQGPKGERGVAGPKGDTPVKGVDYFTTQDIAQITAQIPATDLSSYATKAEVATAIDNAKAGLLKRSIVSTLPLTDIDDSTIYMILKAGNANDVYDEYLYINNAWEHIGSTEVDLSDYVLKSELLDEDVLVKRTDSDISPNVIVLSSDRDLTEDELTIINGIRNGLLSVNDYQFIIDNHKITGIGIGKITNPGYHDDVVGDYAEGLQPIVFVFEDVYVRKKTNYINTTALLRRYHPDRVLIAKDIKAYVLFANAIRLTYLSNGSNSFGSVVGFGGYATILDDYRFTRTSISNAGSLDEAFDYIYNSYLTKSVANSTYMNKNYLTNSDILAIWNGE